MAEAALANLQADRLYLGADGLDPEIGVMTPHLQEAELNAKMIRISRQVVVVADSSKLLRRNISLIAKVEQIHMLITDRAAPAAGGRGVAAAGRRSATGVTRCAHSHSQCCSASGAGCGAASSADAPATGRYYSLADFRRVEKIDAHMHIHGIADRFMAQAIRDNFRILTINVDYPDFPVDRRSAARRRLAAAALSRARGLRRTFSVQDFALPDWTQRRDAPDRPRRARMARSASRSGRTSA